MLVAVLLSVWRCALVPNCLEVVGGGVLQCVGCQRLVVVCLCLRVGTGRRLSFTHLPLSLVDDRVSTPGC